MEDGQWNNFAPKFGQFPRFGQEEFFDKTFETFKSISDR
jgi:hypothetical protein